MGASAGVDTALEVSALNQNGAPDRSPSGGHTINQISRGGDARDSSDKSGGLERQVATTRTFNLATSDYVRVTGAEGAGASCALEAKYNAAKAEITSASVDVFIDPSKFEIVK
jgi:hypothetical protein